MSVFRKAARAFVKEVSVSAAVGLVELGIDWLRNKVMGEEVESVEDSCEACAKRARRRSRPESPEAPEDAPSAPEGPDQGAEGAPRGDYRGGLEVSVDRLAEIKSWKDDVEEWPSMVWVDNVSWLINEVERLRKCWRCDAWEDGDSPCPVHGESPYTEEPSP